MASRMKATCRSAVAFALPKAFFHHRVISRVRRNRRRRAPIPPGGKRVVIVTINDDRGIFFEADLAELILEFVARGDIAINRIDQVRAPIEIGRTGDMTILIDTRVDTDLEDPDL